MLLRQSLKQTLTTKIDPKIILANSILACNTLELNQAIDKELAENPALEGPDEDVCESCTLPRELCSDCPLKPQKAEQADLEEIDWKEWYSSDSEISQEYSSTDDPEFDIISNIGAQRTLHDHLLELLPAVCDKDQVEIGEHIIGSIGTTGYFEGDCEEISAALGVSVEDVEAVLSIVQSLDPPGVGARNLQECLLIQLRALEEQGEGNALALRMVESHWQETSSQKVTRLAHLTKTSVKAVVAALDFIRERLTPYPGEGFRDPWDTNRESFDSVHPDIVVRRTLAGYEFDIVSTERQHISVNKHYRDAYARIRNGGSKSYSDQERKHIVEYVERAENFIRSIIQRRKTLKAITRYVIEFQSGYIETSQKSFLRPLTRTQVGKALGIHESTVSRATANKFVMLPSEEVVSFDLFFDGSNSVKDLILDIIEQEDKSNPLSDQEIADILQQRGLNVARRTVVKYREAQNILSSRQRRRAS